MQVSDTFREILQHFTEDATPGGTATNYFLTRSLGHLRWRWIEVPVAPVRSVSLSLRILIYKARIERLDIIPSDESLGTNVDLTELYNVDYNLLHTYVHARKL
jgi:hypothetical protein